MPTYDKLYKQATMKDILARVNNKNARRGISSEPNVAPNVPKVDDKPYNMYGHFKTAEDKAKDVAPTTSDKPYNMYGHFKTAEDKAKDISKPVDGLIPPTRIPSTQPPSYQSADYSEVLQYVKYGVGGVAIMGAIYLTYKWYKNRTANKQLAIQKAKQVAQTAKQIAVRKNNASGIKKANKAIAMLQANKIN